MKESHNEIMTLKHANEELLQKESNYLDKVKNHPEYILSIASNAGNGEK